MGRTYEALQRAESEFEDRYLTVRSKKYTQAPPPRLTDNERYMEQYDALKYTLLSSYPPGELKTIGLTGTSFGDGASNTAANLAIAMARETWRSVLLVDADLRHPTLHEAFHLPAGSGLSDYLADETVSGPELNKIRSNLFLLTAGSHGASAASFFESPRFDRLLRDTGQRFDHVLLDCPPVTVFSETRVIGGRVDGMLLVLNSGKTRKNVAIMASQSLSKAQVKLLGVVLNRRRFYIPQWLYERV